METHVLGFPRIGVNRELKTALERYWKGAISETELLAVGDELKKRHWRVQQESGLSLVATGDFSFYDQVLDTIAMLGAIPERFGRNDGNGNLVAYFHMARGNVIENTPAMEMTKWFDSNYHYIVPEFTPSLSIHLASEKIIEETRHAISLGYRPKPVLLGPITFLCLGKEYDGAKRWDKLDDITTVYCEVIRKLAPLCDWVQIDEPILCTDLPEVASSVFIPTYQTLKAAAGSSKLLLATYFGELRENLNLALESGCDGLHIDLAQGKGQLNMVLGQIPDTMWLSLGIVAGRNIWKTDLRSSLDLLQSVEKRIGRDRLMIASSCSLLHVPVDLSHETELDQEVKNWLAFAVQKCDEIKILYDVFAGDNRDRELLENYEALQSHRNNPKVYRKEVRQRVASLASDMLYRRSPYADRGREREKWLKLPLFPTTTIGSFPQTREIRSTRLKFKRGQIDSKQYEDFLKSEIRAAVKRQEKLGLDVLVHGEPERNDMVEYFGQQLDGFCFTRNGWVQSYGNRCVKPPVIIGDVSRPEPMTVKWITYAQSLTDKPVKGMLTGPVTILCWSFVRDDLPRSEVCQQIALAIRDEVLDLEKAGISIIQIDEAAFREGLPLRKNDHDTYLRWAVDCFRLTVSGVSDRTQIHTHMCYSEFNTIVNWIAEMDADVISIESSRSKMELLEAFKEFEYPREIGPGVYDIHSPRIPTVEEIKDLLKAALQVIPPHSLWINPDCGLKTRDWVEALPSLRNLITAAKQLRTEYSSDNP
ncbi:MAG: 5-methyltetrahydropteroyltriglutamate--homocysteine methyltransferase [Pelotomaculum sp. PtaB.Bin013]|uniref:5-methyltetrahydropteroyltriglutamate--homocysteine methyltransferase n=1 Tax=Pelotomaculum isophthalicicum JI TaxID=947010 RepID=A0A9X4H6K7_9FIRM|nr:5-methyltetrahydropteroyltriglutamate--homocysteine S-methyltransferase [Pelotomaculum isophthalicicum]MDF9408549.1 5-methyltetrahydropteroyltriglutamate--homocysteine S-methyltransferase [Pelotomaculum isophthalicicum JI]OPX87512.1 MAG: 5-methyltetrahydropteroyltriglutamate--homocysteine methyltransferase [Pelotomaculum sp. PtaB.Bin013]